jgi:hypothetical protein
MATVLKKDVKIGHYYAIRHHDDGPYKLTVIRIDGESIYGGWNATKLKTGRMIRIKSAQKLRGEVILNPDWAPGLTGVKKWMRAS